MTDNPDYPLLVYIYDKNGRYDSPVTVDDNTQLARMFIDRIKSAVERKETIIITDSGDITVFESKNGRIIFPTRDDIDGLFGQTS